MMSLSCSGPWRQRERDSGISCKLGAANLCKIQIREELVFRIARHVHNAVILLRPLIDSPFGSERVRQNYCTVKKEFKKPERPKMTLESTYTG